MENRKMALNDEQADVARGGWEILDLVGYGVGYIFDKITETIDEHYNPQDGCTGEQEIPGFNVI